MRKPKNETICITLSPHAMDERIPLRLGFVPIEKGGSFTGILDGRKTEMAKKKRKRHSEPRLHYDGKLILRDANGKRGKKTHIVIAEHSKEIVTVYRYREGKIDEAVKKRIDRLFGEKKIDSQFLASKLYNPYRQNKLTPKRLEAILEENNIKLDAQESDYLLQRSAENDKLKEQAIEENKATASQLEGQPVDIDASPIQTLLNVYEDRRINARGETVKCTRLIFEDDWPERVMDEWADPDGKITEKAKSLIGRPVFTTVW